MEGLLPELCNRKSVPEIMKKMIAEGRSRHGQLPRVLRVRRADGQSLERTWIEFTYDIRDLIIKHESRLRDAGRWSSKQGPLAWGFMRGRSAARGGGRGDSGANAFAA